MASLLPMLNSVLQNKRQKLLNKNKKAGAAAPPPSKKKDSIRSANDLSDDESLPKPKGGWGYIPPSNDFWRDLEPYFAPFTEGDLKFISPQV